MTRNGLIARRITHDSEILTDKLKLAAAAIPKDPNTMGACTLPKGLNSALKLSIKSLSNDLNIS